VKLVRATQTSLACPSQWDAFDEDGNYWYLRYRHGVGYARCYGPDVTEFDDLTSEEWRHPREVLKFEYGHPLDGDITLDEFALRAGFSLAPELRQVDYTQYLSNSLHARGVSDEHIRAFGLPEPKPESPDEPT
jgi:hypothetical protein